MKTQKVIILSNYKLNVPKHGWRRVIARLSRKAVSVQKFRFVIELQFLQDSATK